MSRTATAVQPHCPTDHYWELGEDIRPPSTKITGVHENFRYSVHCLRCNARATTTAAETCPYCFTTMGNHAVDTEVSRFKHHPDPNTDVLHYAKIHRCPTCDFKCVSYIYDK